MHQWLLLTSLFRWLSLGPLKVSNLLERFNRTLDAISEAQGVYKLQTVGNAGYMAVSNLAKCQTDHAKRIADFAIGALDAANETLVDLDDPAQGVIKIRIGINSGPVGKPFLLPTNFMQTSLMSDVQSNSCNSCGNCLSAILLTWKYCDGHATLVHRTRQDSLFRAFRDHFEAAVPRNPAV